MNTDHKSIKSYKKESNLSYALGAAPAFELIKFKPEKATRMFIHSSFTEREAAGELEALCRKAGLVPEVWDKPFAVLSQKENCFVIGEFEKYNCDIRPDLPHIVLVNPSNAGNMGTIFRTALGFGIHNIVIITPAVDQFDPKTVRASMGALFSLRIKTYPSFEEYANSPDCGARPFYPFMLGASKPLGEQPLEPVCDLIFGNEATGLPESFSGVGQSIIIKHSHAIDSLNLPMAVGIALYDWRRQNPFKE